MTFRIKKYQDVRFDAPFTVGHNRLQGEIRCLLRNQDGRIAQDTGWIPNLVTNRGIFNLANPVGVGTYWDAFHIGSSSQAPAVTDTALVNHLASQSTSLGLSQETFAVAPNYEYSTVRGGRFNSGTGTGTIREMGIGYNNQNTNLTIRTLVTPEIVKGVDQVLDVYHRLTVWPDLTIKTGQLTINGELYDYELRPADMDNARYAYGEYSPSTYGVFAYTGGAFGTITGKPTGTIFTNMLSSYIDLGGTSNLTGTETATFRTTFGLDNANGTWDYFFGLNSWSHRTSGAGNGIQVSLAKVSDGTGMTKDNTQTLELEFQMTWSRYP